MGGASARSGMRPKDSTPVGQLWTHALQRTHSGSAIGRPLFAKLMTSMPWWQTEVQTFHEMHFFLSAKMRKRPTRATTCIQAASGQKKRHQTRPLNQK